MNSFPPPRPVTLRHVANVVGVSLATVSRALRNDPRISSARRAAVQNAAAQLGYRPNPLVSALMSQVRPHRHAHCPVTVATLNCLPRGMPTYAEGYERGIQMRAEAFGYHIEPLVLEDLRPTKCRLDVVLRTRGIHGLIVLPVPSGVRLDDFSYDGLAAATIDTSLKLPRLHRASPDYFQGMTLALGNLTRNGYERIGFATSEGEVERIAELWLAAFLRWQLQVPSSLRVPVHMPARATSTSFLGWFRRERPQAIVSNGALSLGWLSSIGVRMTRDVGFVSLCREAREDITCVDQQNERVGTATFDLVVNQLNRNEYGLPVSPQTVLVEGVWREGTTARTQRG